MNPISISLCFILILQIIVIIKNIYIAHETGQLKDTIKFLFNLVNELIVFCEDNYDDPNFLKKLLTKNIFCCCCQEKIYDDKIIICRNEEHIYCVECINNYVSSLIGDNNCKFKCINSGLGCNFIFDNDYLMQFLNETNLKKLKDLIKYKTVKEKSITIYGYQICPNCCKFGCVTTDDLHYYICEECNYCWCKDCRKKFHSNDPCGIFADFNESNDEPKIRNFISEMLTEILSHKCQKCKVKYVKENGCDHITCPLCKAEMCYNCRTPYLNKIKQCECDIYPTTINTLPKQIKKELHNKLLNLIAVNNNEKIKNIMIDEIEKRGFYVPYEITGDISKSLKHWISNLF